MTRSIALGTSNPHDGVSFWRAAVAKGAILVALGLAFSAPSTALAGCPDPQPTEIGGACAEGETAAAAQIVAYGCMSDDDCADQQICVRAADADADDPGDCVAAPDGASDPPIARTIEQPHEAVSCSYANPEGPASGLGAGAVLAVAVLALNAVGFACRRRHAKPGAE
ncbi:MAG: hypothetical protein U0441_19135 [Polyangiaceae bacterium]